MASKLSPLQHSVPIVDARGQPTPYFIQLLQQLYNEKDVTDALAEGALNSAANLSDLGDIATAVANLGLGLTVQFIVVTGAVGVNVGPELIAPRVGLLTKCKIVTKVSDPAVDLTFTIKKNGATVFAANPTIPHGTAVGTVTTVTPLVASPVAVAANDLFTLDILSGSATWQATIVLE